MKRILLSLCGAFALLCALPMRAQTEKIGKNLPMSVRLAESEMVRCPESWQLDFQPKLKWDYCHGVELQAFLRLEEMYGDSRYFDYAEAYCDTMVREDGTVVAYKREEFSLDRVNTGKILFNMYARTGEAKYKKALDLMYSQFADQPRTKEGGFWHKKVYPHQMWLDGLYMGCPFYAEYAARYGKPEAFQDIINQFCVVARHTYDAPTGLYKHAWDESREMFWCNKENGQSAHSWGRAMGWFAMALVESLEFIPVDEPNRDSMLVILDNVVKQIERYQDKKTGLWYQVLDRSGDKGNYLESSVSAMFIYSLYKGIRLGVVPATYMAVADKGFEGFMDRFIKVEKKTGVVSITDCCAVAGLGGKNNRSGDYDYYINELIRDNDPKAVGPFINACLERERLMPHEGPVTVENKNGKIRILMIGDSTMANKSMKNGNPERGWGMVLQNFFTDAVEVDNHAQNGRSTKSFINEGRWDKVLARIRPGDYVFIQFGHNDEKYKKESVYTVPGGTFDANLRRFVLEARQRGGIPVLFNAIVRRKFDGNRLTCTHGDYLLPPRKVAEETAAYFVDANAITHGIVEPMGPEESKRLFMWLPKGSPSHPKGLQDDTHLNVYGAHRVAWSLISAVCNQIPRLEQHVKYFDFSDL